MIAMNADIVRNVIKRVVSPELSSPSEQQQAMKELQHFENVAGFCSALLNIMQVYRNTASLDVNEVILCVICLKNLVNRHWLQPRGNAAPVLNSDDQVSLKVWLCQWISCSTDSGAFYDKRISTHIYLIIRRIARNDWPAQWPELLPLLYDHITTVPSPVVSAGNRTRVRCLCVLDNILKELSSRRLTSAKKMFSDIAAQLFKPVLEIFKSELVAALLLVFDLCQQHHSQQQLQSDDFATRLYVCFEVLQRCCMLMDVLRLLVHHGMCAEWLETESKSLGEFLGLIMHVFSPAVPASQQLLPVLRYLSQVHQSNIDAGAGVALEMGVERSACLFPVYDEQSSETLLDELATLSDAAHSTNNSMRLGSVYLSASMLTSQLLGIFPSLCRQHTGLATVQESVVQFGQFYHGLLQAELAVSTAGAEVLPGLPCTSADPLTPLSRNIAHTCVLFISHILACGDFHARNPELGAVILDRCCSEPMAHQYTEWCCLVLLSKSSTSGSIDSDGYADGSGSLLSDLELWRTEPEELFQSQESLTERDALRIAAEGLFLAVLEVQPDVVTSYCVLNNPLLSIAQTTTLPVLLNQYSLAPTQLGSMPAVNMHNNLVLYADNLFLCLGLGFFHFAHIDTQLELSVGSMLYQNMLIPVLSFLIESPDTGAFDVVASGKLVARLPLLQVRLCWLITCSLYTISNDTVVMKRVLELCCCLLTVSGSTIDVVLAMQVCDTISSILLNADSHGPGNSIFELLLNDFRPRSDPGTSFSYLSYIVTALSYLLLHPEKFSGEQDNYFESHTKIIALLTELIAHYDMSTLSRLGMESVYYSLLSAYVQLWTTHVSQSLNGSTTMFSPAYPTAIIDSIGKLLLIINNNITEQLRTASSTIDVDSNVSGIINSAAVSSFASLYPQVIDIIQVSVGGKLSQQLSQALGTEGVAGASADANACQDDCLDTCRLEGVLLWGSVLRSCPPALSQVTMRTGIETVSLDSLLLRLFASHFAPLFTSDVLQSGSTDMPKALMLVLEGYLLRYAPFCIQEMVAGAGSKSQVIHSLNAKEQMATVFNQVLEVVANRTIGNCSPRAVSIIMRPWVAVLGIANPWCTVQLLAHYGQHTGQGLGESVSVLTAILRIISASSLSLCAHELSQTSVGKRFSDAAGAGTGTVMDQLAHAVVEYRENNSGVANYVSILCYAMAFSVDQLDASVNQLLVSLARENRQLGEMLCPSGNVQQLEAAVTELVPWVFVSYIRFTLEMFETLTDNSKSCYFQRRLWCMALLSVYEDTRLARMTADVQRTLLFDLFPQVLLLIDGSSLLDLEVDAVASGMPSSDQDQVPSLSASEAAVPYHLELFKPQSRQLLSLCHVSLTTSFNVEDITDDDDEIVRRVGGGWCSASCDSDSDMGGGMDDWGQQNSQEFSESVQPARSAVYPSAIHMYGDALLRSDVMKSSLVELVKTRLHSAIRLCDQCSPAQRGLLQQAVVRVTGSDDILRKYM